LIAMEKVLDMLQRFLASCELQSSLRGLHSAGSAETINGRHLCYKTRKATEADA